MKLRQNAKQVAWYNHLSDALVCAFMIKGHFRAMVSCGSYGYGVFEGAKYEPMPLPK